MTFEKGTALEKVCEKTFNDSPPGLPRQLIGSSYVLTYWKETRKDSTTKMSLTLVVINAPTNGGVVHYHAEDIPAIKQGQPSQAYLDSIISQLFTEELLIQRLPTAYGIQFAKKNS